MGARVRVTILGCERTCWNSENGLRVDWGTVAQPGEFMKGHVTACFQRITVRVISYSTRNCLKKGRGRREEEDGVAEEGPLASGCMALS